MARRRFMQCDVFTSTPTKGNGLAVVIDADGLSDAQMQDFAAWTNLAETTFLLPPTDPAADYRVRIFTPAREMLFAGHPTLGSCACWLKAGCAPRDPQRVVQECGVGLVEIDHTGTLPAFVAPPTKIDPMDPTERARIVAALALDPAKILRTARLENGPVWQAFELASADDVLAADWSAVRWPDFKAIGLIGAHPTGAPTQYEVRMLAPSSGMSEDPITGSLNAALARWMRSEGRLPADIMVSQGTSIDRHGRIAIRPDPADPERTLIGGETLILIEGSVDL